MNVTIRLDDELKNVPKKIAKIITKTKNKKTAKRPTKIKKFKDLLGFFAAKYVLKNACHQWYHEEYSTFEGTG